MLINPTILTDLQANSPSTDKTIDFLKNAMKGLLYVELSVVGSDVSGQVKTGDGVNVSTICKVLVRTVPLELMTTTVVAGVALYGEGTGSVLLNTNASGQFTVTTTAPAVEVTPHLGVTTIAVL